MSSFCDGGSPSAPPSNSTSEKAFHIPYSCETNSLHEVRLALTVLSYTVKIKLAILIPLPQMVCSWSKFGVQVTLMFYSVAMYIAIPNYTLVKRFCV